MVDQARQTLDLLVAIRQELRGAPLVQKGTYHLLNVVLVRPASSLRVVAVEDAGPRLVDLTSEGAGQDFAVEQNIQIFRLCRIRVYELILDVLHAVVLAIQVERVRFSFLGPFLFLFGLAPLGLHNAVPVHEALTRARPGQVRQALLLGLLFLLLALEEFLALLFGLNQTPQVV